MNATLLSCCCTCPAYMYCKKIYSYRFLTRKCRTTYQNLIIQDHIQLISRPILTTYPINTQLLYLSEKYVKCYYNLIEVRNHPKTYASGINNGRTLTLEHPRRTPNTPTQLHRLLANECIAFILRLPLSKVHTQTILAATHQIPNSCNVHAFLSGLVRNSITRFVIGQSTITKVCH